MYSHTVHSHTVHSIQCCLLTRFFLSFSVTDGKTEDQGKHGEHNLIPWLLAALIEKTQTFKYVADFLRCCLFKNYTTFDWGLTDKVHSTEYSVEML